MITNLSKGFTANTIVRIDNSIVKSAATVEDEYAWYTAYKDKADIPLDVSLNGNLLFMRYVERAGDIDINEVVNLVKKYQNYPRLNDSSYYLYCGRIANHLSNNERITNGEKLMGKLGQIFLMPSFSHGDLSIDNIIPSPTGIKLIDPLYSKNTFGSYILDYAKLLFSLKFYAADIARFAYLNSLVDVPPCFIASECVRVATYKKQYSFIAENLINEL